ncbi:MULTISPECIES: ABC transporter ATP-binding protein [unclassified Streptomyces]|uniref:ABC transporter ATP-binding protein n=1 Tax=unclassified Streptomyces TaxID=2593676 RepID=UPI002DDC3C2A|nr:MULTISPECIES: ABC transporter ATP-binding protein [unclassified Streptomyces]WSA91849.1 ABC transporter ATP-binding protein [Streptomyces sp. NBC_01795]WSB76219.1 ABC transporter ATP-binding protein [Streptomyces sp. NBC_01775]WSS15507.1 ABC transporter ATP-binding protein [Streptomyces sp. NBC_01186]WSS44349.1 ABC transporter ATP-binding protein [Streptomyces sp. NBC_01187]
MITATSAADLAPTTYAFEVEARDLRVRAGRTTAVDGMDLSLGTGVHGLLGPNGAGKTTLIRALATVLAPSGGTLELLGTPSGAYGPQREVRRRVGYLPQDFGYYRRFTVREFVEYMAWLKEVPRAEVPGAVQRAVERVGLADRADDRLKTLSGGMVRRAGIAQAIVNDPRLVLLDEPTVGLDPAQRLRFRELLQEMGTESCVVVSTHLVEDVAAACTDVILMNSGKLVFQGTPDKLAAAGQGGAAGDSPIERGYTALLSGVPAERGTW